MFTFETPKEEIRVHKGPKVQRDRRIDTIRNDLIRFLKDNPDYEGSTRLIARKLGCSYRTIHHYVSELTGSGFLSVQRNKESGRKQTSFFSLSEEIEPKKAPVECSISALVHIYLNILNNPVVISKSIKEKLNIETTAFFEHLDALQLNTFLRLLKRDDYTDLYNRFPELAGLSVGKAYKKAVAQWDLEYQKRRVERAKKYGLASRVKTSRAYKKAEIIYNTYHDPEKLPDYMKTIIENRFEETLHDYIEYPLEKFGDWWLYPESYKTWYYNKREEIGEDKFWSKFKKWPDPDINRKELFKAKLETAWELRGYYLFDSMDLLHLDELEKRGPVIGAFRELEELKRKNDDLRDEIMEEISKRHYEEMVASGEIIPPDGWGEDSGWEEEERIDDEETHPTICHG